MPEEKVEIPITKMQAQIYQQAQARLEAAQETSRVLVSMLMAGKDITVASQAYLDYSDVENPKLVVTVPPKEVSKPDSKDA